MPHCIVEFSNTLRAHLEPNELMDKVTQGAAESGLFELKDIKTHAMGFDYFQSAGQSENANFIHVEIKLLAGRELSQRQHLSASVLDSLLKLNLNHISISVEINDLDTPCYAKKVIE